MPDNQEFKRKVKIIFLINGTFPIFESGSRMIFQ